VDGLQIPPVPRIGQSLIPLVASTPTTTWDVAKTILLCTSRKLSLALSTSLPIEGSAVPCCGITGWHAFMTKSGNAVPGRNIFVTGIGGGVALQVLQYGVALGCNMYVSSSSEEKIKKALEMGAKGGVNYSRTNWEKTLSGILPSERPFLDAVIDGAGGNIMIKVTDLLKPGGVVVVYGMTVAPTLDWPMQAVLKNVDLRGSTLGSRVEFAEMVNFIRDNKIKPIVSRSVKGLDCVKAIDGLFEDIKEGKQFGKLVVEI
jgi:D-arabinose 1-dehydrogenase-like Zn-dependent alcohol dehydrogenase